jgi:hypothetical protein
MSYYCLEGTKYNMRIIYHDKLVDSLQINSKLAVSCYLNYFSYAFLLMSVLA